MPYTVYFDPNEDDLRGKWTVMADDAESWKERNKDELIDRLVWIIRRMDMACVVEYPDGERY